MDAPADAIWTDIAREWVERKKITVVEATRKTSATKVDVAIGSDHSGFDMKSRLRELLDAMGVRFHDYGTYSKDSVDYPDVAHRVAVAVSLGHARQGIVIDGAGIGSAIAANKVPGIRAGACGDETLARNAREHNDINVLTLGARTMPPENLRPVLGVFLSAELSEPRHRARVLKIEGIEKKYYRTL
jgi:ribose 5-phosphate isomerase B